MHKILYFICSVAGFIAAGFGLNEAQASTNRYEMSVQETDKSSPLNFSDVIQKHSAQRDNYNVAGHYSHSSHVSHHSHRSHVSHYSGY